MHFFFTGGQIRRLFLCLLLFLAASPDVRAQQTSFGINLSGGREPVKIEADGMEMRNREGLAIFTGNVSVVQGARILRAGRMIVYYTKSGEKTAKKTPDSGLGSTGIDRMEASGSVYIRVGDQVATGDQGVFDGKSNVMVLTGSKVVLTDGNSVASGCRLTAHMHSGRAFLESCSPAQKKGRVSIIVDRDGENHDEKD